MKKLFVFALLSLFALVLNAADPIRTQVQVDSGPIIKVPGSGKVIVFDCVSLEAEYKKSVEVTLKKLENILQVPIELQRGKSSSGLFDRDMGGGQVVVYIDCLKEWPLSIVVLEGRYALVNSDSLSSDRLSKEVVRMLTVLLGGANSRYPASAMQNVSSAEDLDRVGSILGFDSLMNIAPRLGELGLTQSRVMSYRDACLEGVAPKPSNDREQKIWNEVNKTK